MLPAITERDFTSVAASSAIEILRFSRRGWTWTTRRRERSTTLVILHLTESGVLVCPQVNGGGGGRPEDVREKRLRSTSSLRRNRGAEIAVAAGANLA
jgi:hypothetical protein